MTTPFVYNPRVKLSEWRQFEWLRRSQSWDGLDPKEWQAKMVLGNGTNGVCGLWEYIGNMPDMPKHMAIKQCTPLPSAKTDLYVESEMLKALSSTGTTHAPRLYREFHLASGTGTTGRNQFDGMPFGKPEDVSIGDLDTFKDEWTDSRLTARIYMEYCLGGDLSQWKTAIRAADRQRIIPEEVLWRILSSYAKAILVFETGTEDPSVPDPMWTQPICHFDIKGANTLVGELHEDESRRFPPLKLADYGLSRFDPKELGLRQSAEWRTGTHWRGTPGYLAPEQYFYDQKYPTWEISTKVNIWQVGAVLYRLICREDVAIESNFRHDPPYDIVGPQPQYRVCGNPEVLLNPVQCPYSSRLIDVICYCLAQSPDRRMTSQELVIECSKVLEIYDTQHVSNASDAMTGQNVPPQGSDMQDFDMPDTETQTPQGDKPPTEEVPMEGTDQVFNPLFPKGPRPYVYDDVDNYPYQYLGDTPAGKKGVQPSAPHAGPTGPLDPNLPKPSPERWGQLGKIVQVEETPTPDVEA